MNEEDKYCEYGIKDIFYVLSYLCLISIVLMIYGSVFLALFGFFKYQELMLFIENSFKFLIFSSAINLILGLITHLLTCKRPCYFDIIPVIHRGNFKELKTLLKKYKTKMFKDPINKDCYYNNMTRFLFEAINFNNIRMIKLLLKLGADPNKLVEGYSALHYAIYLNKIKIVRILLKYGADKNILNKNGKSAYNLALETKNPEIIKLIFDRVDKNTIKLIQQRCKNE